MPVEKPSNHGRRALMAHAASKVGREAFVNRTNSRNSCWTTRHGQMTTRGFWFPHQARLDAVVAVSSPSSPLLLCPFSTTLHRISREASENSCRPAEKHSVESIPCPFSAHLPLLGPVKIRAPVWFSRGFPNLGMVADCR